MPRREHKKTPTITSGVLYTDDQSDGMHVGSAQWFAWLKAAATFYYDDPDHPFSARAERRARGGVYWFAYRQVAGKLYNAYMGKADKLNAGKLADVADKLAIRAAQDLKLPGQVNTPNLKPLTELDTLPPVAPLIVGLPAQLTQTPEAHFTHEQHVVLGWLAQNGECRLGRSTTVHRAGSSAGDIYYVHGITARRLADIGLCELRASYALRWSGTLASLTDAGRQVIETLTIPKQPTQDVIATNTNQDKGKRKNPTKQPVQPSIPAQPTVTDSGLYILHLMLSDPQIKGVLCFNWRLSHMRAQRPTVNELAALSLIALLSYGRDGHYYRITDAGRDYHAQHADRAARLISSDVWLR